MTLDEEKIRFFLKLLIQLSSGLPSQNAGLRLSCDAAEREVGWVGSWVGAALTFFGHALPQ